MKGKVFSPHQSPLDWIGFVARGMSPLLLLSLRLLTIRYIATAILLHAFSAARGSYRSYGSTRLHRVETPPWSPGMGPGAWSLEPGACVVAELWNVERVPQRPLAKFPLIYNRCLTYIAGIHVVTQQLQSRLPPVDPFSNSPDSDAASSQPGRTDLTS